MTYEQFMSLKKGQKVRALTGEGWAHDTGDILTVEEVPEEGNNNVAVFNIGRSVGDGFFAMLSEERFGPGCHPVSSEFHNDFELVED